MLTVSLIHRLAAWAVLIGVAVALIVGLALPVRNYVFDLDADLESRHAALGRLQAIIQYGQRVDDTRSGASPESFAGDFLAGEQEPVVIADLQSRLRATALGKGVEFNSANTLPSRTIGTHTYLGLRIVLRGQLKDIQQLLHAIESSVPLLFVERAILRLDAKPMAGGDATREHIPALLAELDVFGARIGANARANTRAAR